MSVQCADDVTLRDLLIYVSQVFSYRLLEFRATNSSFETSEDSVMEANRASDTYLAHSNPRHLHSATQPCTDML